MIGLIFHTKQAPPVIVLPLEKSREGTESSQKSRKKRSKYSVISLPKKNMLKDKMLSMTTKAKPEFKPRLGSTSSKKSLTSVGSGKSGKDDIDKKS